MPFSRGEGFGVLLFAQVYCEQSRHLVPAGNWASSLGGLGVMSRYLQELCDSLCRVLDHCAQLDRRRLAGYVANIDFWVAEIQHRLNLIEGYVGRRRMMVAGTDQVYADDIRRRSPYDSPPDVERLITPNALDVSTDWEALQNESAKLREQVLASAKRFVKRCVATELIDQNKLFAIEDQLAVNLR